jgi:hypothetical protein
VVRRSCPWGVAVFRYVVRVVVAAAITPALVALGAVGAGTAGATPNVVPISGTSTLASIYCRSANWCLAVGRGTFTISVDGQDGGVQYVPDEATEGINLYAMACPTTADCFAVGYWNGTVPNPPGGSDGVVVPFIYGAVQTPIEVPAVSALNAIACTPGTTSCTAVGYETLSFTVKPYQEAALVNLDNGNPTGAVQDLPSMYTLSGVACPSAGSCLAAGEDSSSGTGDLLAIDAGVPQTPQNVAGTYALNAITCAAAAQCWASGSSTGSQEILPVVNGTPGTLTAVSGVSNIDSITCPSTAQCYLSGAASSGGYVAAVTNGTAGTPQIDISPAGSSVNDLSCVSAGQCVGAGRESGVNASGVLVTSAAPTPAPAISSVAFSGSGYGVKVTVKGTNFGDWAPSASPDSPTTCVSTRPISYDYAQGVLDFNDSTGGWDAGGPGDCIGLIVASWSNTKVVLEFGAAYVWPLLNAADKYQVSVLGATYSGTASVPSVPAPSITSVVVSNFGSASPTVTVSGSNFGTRIPVPSPGTPLTCVPGDTSYDYTDYELYFSDLTNSWNAGQDPSCIGMIVHSWTPTQVVYGFGADYQPYMGIGDGIQQTVLSASFNGSAANPAPPAITGLTVTGSKAAPVVTITGSGFGTSPPAPGGQPACVSGDTSDTYETGILSFTDNTNGVLGGLVGGCLGLVVKSWTTTQVVLGFGAQYPQTSEISAGDSVTLTVLGTSFSAKAKV